jgi:flavin-dependent dehydrogenase
MVSFEHEGRTLEVEARWVLDCTGRTGLIARGWRRAESTGRTMALVGIWERQDAWPMEDDTHTLVESYERGWGWSVPVSAARRYVTLMVDPDITTLAQRGRLASNYDEELSATRSLRRLIEGAMRIGEPFARDASSYTAHRFGDDGVLLVGDAGSFVDPLSSYGVKKALVSAWLAAIVTHSCVVDPDATDAALALYESRERAMYQALRRRLEDLSRDAAAAHPTRFWETRMEADDVSAMETTSIDEGDVAALRNDADVVAALNELKRRESIRLLQTSALRRVSRATVHGNRVVIQDHLVVPAFPDGVRYVRNVDLVRLSDLAVAHDQVPDLFDAYNRAAPPAPLPDFLGALSVLIGKGVLHFA